MSPNDDLIAALGRELLGTPYRPLRLLGRGGMGSVVEAEHTLLGHKVVIKFVTSAERKDLQDRLRMEAQMLARIQHPHVLTIIDLQPTKSGRVYLVTEKLEGETLKETLERRKWLPVAEAIDIARQSLAGLTAAHAIGLVHRDVKPDNLFLCAGSSPHVKVIDFGIAKIVMRGGQLRTALRAIKPLAAPTAEHQMLGTPHVLAPEQVAAQEVDARTDIYAMGIVLFRMLTGEYVFTGRSIDEIVMAHVTERPRTAGSVNTQPIPASLEAIIARALAKNPADRFQSADEMSEALVRSAKVGADAPRNQPRATKEPLPTEPLSATRETPQARVAVGDTFTGSGATFAEAPERPREEAAGLAMPRTDKRRPGRQRSIPVERRAIYQRSPVAEARLDAPANAHEAPMSTSEPKTAWTIVAIVTGLAIALGLVLLALKLTGKL